MKRKLAFILLLFVSQISHAQPEHVQLSVWVNEAIVGTYTYNYKTFIEDQKRIAKYFTADGWIAYSNALNYSKLPDMIQKNLYYVSSVATEPPVLTNIDETHWKASIGLLVVYKNPQYQQRQHLHVTITFMPAPSGQGVRGFSITSLQSVERTPLCKCLLDEENNPTPSPSPNTPNNKP
ncbi:MAG: DotI/IcmL family type IV secretion protein [Legionella sp.]